MIASDPTVAVIGRGAPRRGMLLLLVLSMLSLFMVMGALGIVLSTRARESARAFAEASASQVGSPALARAQLDEALMLLLRGSPEANPPVGGATQLPESLLADRYGQPYHIGEASQVNRQSGSPNIEARINMDKQKAVGINGRVITFVPRATDPTGPTSYRLLQGNGATCVVANARPTTPLPLPTGSCEYVVNGREFSGGATNEPYDAFDDANPFLARLRSGSSGVEEVLRPSFGAGNGQALQVDNDGDGVRDGIWLTDVLRSRAAPGGGEMTFAVSYLVVDLDGCVNVNAHGAAAAAGGRPGPADIDPSSLFGQAAWSVVLQGGQPPGRATTASDTQWRPAPVLATQVDGRGSADPYMLRLDGDGPRVGRLRGQPAPANLFTPGELERVLRQFDADAATLPPRLAAILDDSAQKLRMLVTTDGWDTPGIVGVAASNIEKADALKLPADAAACLRFNLNRPLPDDAAKQRYFDDFYRVLGDIGAGSGPSVAQWVANVIEFLDEDMAEGKYKSPIPAGADITGAEPPSKGELGEWNRGAFRSVAELLAVPDCTPQELKDAVNDEKLNTLTSPANDKRMILDAVTVPSRFVAAAELGSDTDGLSRWREPGRVNVNTCDDRVWQALAGGSGSNPFVTVPAKDTLDMLTRSFPADNVEAAVGNLDAMNKLANCGTTRSHVFAVWITLKISDSSTNAGAPSFHRLFAIVDRSIPVGYRPGVNLNAREAIRLQRFLE